MTDAAILEAAEKRAAAIRSSADRPSKRRNAENPQAPARVLTRRPMALRAAGEGGSGFDFEGYASVTGVPYEMYDMFGPYLEVVAPGAFTKTLATPDLDVPLVLDHDSMRRIARTLNGTLSLSEDEVGLLCLAPGLDPADADVSYIAPKIKSGLIDEMSFRFYITAGIWSPDYTIFQITEVDINRGDVSIVGYGANPATSAQLRALERAAAELGTATPEELRVLERALRAEQVSRGIAPAMTLADLLAVKTD